MPTKDHKQKILQIEEEYCKRGFKCKKNFPLYNPDDNTFSLIDLVCFRGNQARGFEIEVSGAQVIENSKDLKRFKSIFKNAKICQLTTNMDVSDCDDFKKN